MIYVAQFAELVLMNNRDYSLWLIPLLAVLISAVPLSSEKQLATIPSTSAATSGAGEPPKNKVAKPKYNATSLIEDYLGNSVVSSVSSSLKVQFLIATLPDPHDSNLSYLFDRYVASIQRAVETAGVCS